MTHGTTPTDFKPGQLKTLIRRMATQVESCLLLHAFLPGVQYGAWKLVLVFSINVFLTYLLLRIIVEIFAHSEGKRLADELIEVETTAKICSHTS